MFTNTEIGALVLIFLTLVIGYVIGWLGGRRQFWQKGHFAGQIAMKERVRRQINDNIAAKNITVQFRNGQEISAEQLLQFICYGVAPNPDDLSGGVATYKPE